MEENICYVPLDVKMKSEIISGFGKAELVKSIWGIILGSVLGFVLYLITKEQIATVICIGVCIAVSISLNIKDRTTNMSFIDEIGNVIRFAKHPKVYMYSYLPETEFEKVIKCKR